LSDAFESNPKGMKIPDTDMAGLYAYYIEAEIPTKK
jgi:hypothetical protein